MLDHAIWFLLGWVFCNQAGVPVPIIPALIGMGALAGNGFLSMPAIIASAVGACLAADLLWYGLGRWRGERALKILSRLSPSAGVLIYRAQHVFSAHEGVFQLSARFLPELNAIAAGLAGVTRNSFPRFMLYGLLSALTWAGGWIGLGYLVSQLITETAVRLGVRLIVLFLAAFALYLPFRRTRRHRLIQTLRRVPLTLDDLEERRSMTDHIRGPESIRTNLPQRPLKTPLSTRPAMIETAGRGEHAR